MPRKEKPAAFEESLINDDAREEEEARAQEYELLRVKHQLKIDECRIKQQREELTLRMRHANIISEYLPTMTASMNKHLCENHSTISNIDGAVNVTSTKNAPEVASASMAEYTRSLVDALLKGQEQQSKLVAALQMTKVELQVFDGNPLQFWSIMRLF